MSEIIHVPNIGGEGAVIEILVNVGDRVEAEQSILTLESDKASMEVPTAKAGIVKKILFKMGDTLKEGDPMIELETEGAAATAAPAAQSTPAPQAATTPAPQAAPAVAGGIETILVPDLGGSGAVIEILVKEGDRVEAEQSIMTLESDKASMEVPTPKAGIVKKILFKMGDTLEEGKPMIELEVAGSAPQAVTAATTTPAQAPAPAPQAAAPVAGGVKTIHVPDLGGSGAVIEILVKEGDRVEAEQSIMTLESDKASMEVPTPEAGIVKKILFKMGDTLEEGKPMIELEVVGSAPAPVQAVSTPAVANTVAAPTPAVAPAATAPAGNTAKVHAGPAVRQLARELGVDLGLVPATGPRGRIMKEDVQGFVKQQLQQPRTAAPAAPVASGSGIPQVPVVDFSRFGEIEEKPLTRLMQAGATNLHRSWLNVPHVTHFEQSDITGLEAYRKDLKSVAEKQGAKITILPFLLKACAYMLQEMPNFNSSLAPDGKSLILKKYVHIGFAVDTPDGLLVPVIRNVNQKGLVQLAKEAAELAAKARDKKLKADDMQGACFTISSLGHIGGTGFTPIVNTPEVAILGVTKATMQPVWNGSEFVPRLMLPLSLSYDHRAINGAAAAQFAKRLADVLADVRSMLL